MADLREWRGPKVPFFGHLAPTNAFPAMLAVSLGKPVFVAHVMRESGVHFKIRMEEVEVAQTGDREADILATTTNIQAALERNIRARPGEWMWSLGRWA
jgi:KDO2-lipid IV(A) lauroyltransferase